MDGESNICFGKRNTFIDEDTNTWVYNSTVTILMFYVKCWVFYSCITVQWKLKSAIRICVVSRITVGTTVVQFSYLFEIILYGIAKKSILQDVWRAEYPT